METSFKWGGLWGEVEEEASCGVYSLGRGADHGLLGKWLKDERSASAKGSLETELYGWLSLFVYFQDSLFILGKRI